MTKSFIFKFSAAAAAAVISLTAVCGGDFGYSASYEDEISSLEERRAEISQKREQLESELAEYREGAETQEGYLKLYNEKMELQEEEMNNLTAQIKSIDKKMKELDVKIAEKQVEVDNGIETFRERLRAMYIAGNDTVAEVLAGSSSFYDMLARLEMVQRVSKHDNDMISDLCGKVQELDADKTALEEQRTKLDEKKTEQLGVLDKLRETYANHEETKKWYEDKAAAQAELTDEMIEQENQAEEELQEFIRKQQAEIAEKMAAKKKKQEEERKAKEEEALRQKKLEEEQQKAAEESKAAETTAAVDKNDFEDVPFEDEFAGEQVTSATSAQINEDDYDVYSPDGEDDDFGIVTTAAETEWENQGRADDPYDTYEFGKVYYAGEDDTSGDKGYGTSSDTGFIWPVPTVRNISDGYGYRTIAEEGGASSNHKGIDINKPNCSGEEIVASAGGVVITASNTGNGYGIHVVIDHGDNISTLYGHMSSAAVSVGDEVQQGQVIGYIGNTGYAYGYHCHFEVRINGQHTDPLNYVSIDN